MKFTASVSATAVIARFEKMPGRVHSKVVNAVDAAGKNLRTYIVQNKLRGQVLNRRTGALGRSIQQELTTSTDGATSTVFSSNDVKYAAIHEFGGKTPPHMIYPKNAQALHFMMGGKEVFAKSVNHPGSNMPERSYMRSSLKENQEAIFNLINKSVGEAVNE